MRILAVDVGTGTQDILLFEPGQPIENSPKLVMPSPTVRAERQVREATRSGRPVLLVGTIAGGGPCAWAFEDHLRAGLPGFATREAALTLNDDPRRVEELGATLVSEDETRRIDAERVELRDLDLGAIRDALALFGVDRRLDGIAVGVLDHGHAPPGVSDRVFRFAHIQRVLSSDAALRSFAFRREDIPEYLTRARAVVSSLPEDIPVVFMDNGPAAALGALHDPVVAAQPRRAVLNVGNMHALGFVLDGEQVHAVFEHHTGEITPERLAGMVGELIAGGLTNEEVLESHGHGALYVSTPPPAPSLVAVTGPRRAAAYEHLARGTLPAHLAAPYGDMMISGCFGLLDGFAYRVPEAREELEAHLRGAANASSR